MLWAFQRFLFEKPALIISYLGWDRFVIATICMSHQTRAEGLQDPSAYRVFIYCMCVWCGVEWSLFILPVQLLPFFLILFPLFMFRPSLQKRIEFYFIFFYRRYFALHCVIFFPLNLPSLICFVSSASFSCEARLLFWGKWIPRLHFVCG